MAKQYYEINEKTARQAHEMMSFRDYVEGSKTAEYQRMVDRAYEIADSAAKDRPDEAGRIYSLADRYARKLADNMNKDSQIGTRCPSVMISGGSNFPVRKKEKQVAAWEQNHKEWGEIQGILDKIQSIRNGKGIIKSGDEDAIEKLEKKIDGLRQLQENMKAANKAVRMKDKAKGDVKLKELGYTDGQIVELRTPDWCGRVGFASFELSNNNQNIHRLEDRLKTLKAAKERGTKEMETEFFKVVENPEAMRLQLFFDGKPEADVRSVLKSNGFRWAPSNSCWQRHLNNESRYALERVIKELDKQKAG